MSIETLDGACPTRPGEDADAVDGLVPASVACPGSVDEAAAVMRAAAARGLRVLPRGAGTQLAYGTPSQGYDLVVDTARLDGVLEHAAGDLVCRVQAGIPLQRLQERLAPAGQQLALDEPAPGATVGGILATASSGPVRLRYGTPRDLVIGITVVRADGTVAHSGGKVVKNVAGYDLAKLYTGSYGTLGLIVEAAFRLHPRPAARCFVTCQAADAASAYQKVQAIIGSQLMPTALEVDRAGPGESLSVGILLDGNAGGVAARSRESARLLGGDAGDSGDVELAESPPPWWTPLPHDIQVKVTAEISALGRILDTVDAAGDRAGLRPAVRGSAGAGVWHVGLPGGAEPAAVAAFLHALRPAVASHGGTAVVQRAPTAVRAAVDVWGAVGGLRLMRAVKDQFDPEHRLCPGRVAGDTGYHGGWPEGVESD